VDQRNEIVLAFYSFELIKLKAFQLSNCVFKKCLSVGLIPKKSKKTSMEA